MTKTLPYCEDSELYPKGPHDDLNKFLLIFLGLIWLFDLYPGSDGLWLVRFRASLKCYLEEKIKVFQNLPKGLPNWPKSLSIPYPRRLLSFIGAFVRMFHLETWPTMLDDFLEAATTNKPSERDVKDGLKLIYKIILVTWFAWHVYNGDFWEKLLDWWYYDPERQIGPVTPVRFITDPENPHVFKYEPIQTCNPDL